MIATKALLVDAPDTARSARHPALPRLIVPRHADALMDMIMETSCTTIAFIEGERTLELGIATRLERPDDDLSGRASGGGPRRGATDPLSRDVKAIGAA